MKTLLLVLGLAVSVAGCVAPDRQGPSARAASRHAAAPVVLGIGY
ncbi:MAG TPA: hypothetical protein VHL98_18870 [Microvirga sp.]|jgi:hypothetical protein|nr:hypothetical protein [Microvirga sp.]